MTEYNGGADRRQIKPLSSRAIWFSVIAIVLVAAAAGYLVVRYLAGSDSNSRIDALRLAGQIVLGTGGLFALYFTARRQQWVELTLQQQRDVADATERDALERRITELFSKAADQIGNDRASVRIAGLYSLERLGDDAPSQRAKVMDVLCGYLRMPPADPDDRQEIEVRLTAQRIIASRTNRSPSEGQHWTDSRLNLAGARLNNFSLVDCSLHSLILEDSYLEGSTHFQRLHVAHEMRLDRAHITADLEFDGRAGCLSFRSGVFDGDVSFSGLEITGSFEGTAIGLDGEESTFTGSFDCRALKVADMVALKRCIFKSEVLFGYAVLSDLVEFDGSTFADYLSFQNATLNHYLVASQCEFAGNVDISDVEIWGKCRFNGATFKRYFECERAVVHNSVEFSGARFCALAEFGDSEFRESAWFHKAEFGSSRDDEAEEFPLMRQASFVGCKVAGPFTLSEATFYAAVYFGQDSNARLDGARAVAGVAQRWPKGWALGSPKVSGDGSEPDLHPLVRADGVADDPDS